MLCPSCGATVSAATGQCEFCGRDLRDPMTVRPPRAAVPRPSRFQVEDNGFEFVIFWRWFTPIAFFLVFFAIAWNGFLFGWYAMALSMPSGFGPGRLIAMVFPIAHVAVGVGLIYAVATLFVNSTRIRVRQGELTVHHGPIYYPGNLTLDAGQIDQFFVAEQTQTNKGKTSHIYTVKLRLKDQSTRDLIRHLTDPGEAEYLEQSLERYLRITDERVGGEYSRA